MFTLKLTECQNMLFNEYLFDAPGGSLFGSGWANWFTGDLTELDEDNRMLVIIARKKKDLVVRSLNIKELEFIESQINFSFHGRSMSPRRSNSMQWERKVKTMLLKKINSFKTKEYKREVALDQILSQCSINI